MGGGIIVIACVHLSVWLLAKYLKKFLGILNKFGVQIPYHPMTNPLTLGGHGGSTRSIFEPKQR
jgi:hypothetical protein